MTKQAFRRTIEYKERFKLIRLNLIASISVNVIFDLIGIIAYLHFSNFDLNVARIVLISIIIFALLIVLPYICYSYYLFKKLNDIYCGTNDMYVFEYKLDLPIESKSSQSKYLITFNYKDKTHNLMTTWIYNKNNLDNKKISVGFIEKMNLIIVISQI